MRETNIIEKFLTSLLNSAVPFALFFLILVFPIDYFNKKIFLVLAFFVWNFVYYIAEPTHRFYGMNILNTHWEREYTKTRSMLYLLLYTASFSTLFFYIVTPLDLFFINMFLIQPAVIFKTKTTLHGWICGVVTVRDTDPADFGIPMPTKPALRDYFFVSFDSSDPSDSSAASSFFATASSSEDSLSEPSSAATSSATGDSSDTDSLSAPASPSS